MVDVAIVGAGFSGLSCARQIQSHGYSAIVLEKSKGLGGRVATRRVGNTCFNYGARYFQAHGAHTKALLQEMQNISDADTPQLTSWPRTRVAMNCDGSYQVLPQADGYLPSNGMTAIAKYLARGLDVRRQHRVQSLHFTDDRMWEIYTDPHGEPVLKTRAVVLAMPAPQALTLLAPLTQLGLSSDVLDAVQSVEFSPCFTVITGYSASHEFNHPTRRSEWDEICFAPGSDIDWLGLTRSPDLSTAHLPEANTEERDHAQSHIVVSQSSPAFAEQYLHETDRQGVGDRLLERLSYQLKEPALQHPDWMQVHLWRYSFCKKPTVHPFLLTLSPGIIGCAGDWCRGQTIEHALSSGVSLGHALSQRL